MSALPTRPAHRTPETEPFWSGCAAGRLVLPRCRGCSHLIWYPRSFCPACASTDIEWVDVAGTGTIYSFTVVRKGAGPFAPVSPYVLTYVELTEGPRVLTNIVDCDVETVAVGMAVRVVFDPAGESDALFRFTPS